MKDQFNKVLNLAGISGAGISEQNSNGRPNSSINKEVMTKEL